ncbi:MAG TPA: hypothetical protein VGG37_06800 [Opitutaceae bacterium]|jgi:hypothetical protein
MKNPRLHLLLILAGWAAAAALFAGSGALAALPRAIGPAVVAGLVIVFSILVLGRGWVGAAVRSIGLRGILALHVARFVGFAFLWLEARGRLPSEFAERAGWGDVAAAAWALLLLFAPRRSWVAAWAVFGLLDLGVAVGTAAWLNVVRPGAMAEISRLPLALIPLWAVPVLAATSLLVLFRGPSIAASPGSPAWGARRAA